MRRREFIALLGSTAFVGSRATRAQQRAIPVVGLPEIVPRFVARSGSKLRPGVAG